MKLYKVELKLPAITQPSEPTCWWFIGKPTGKEIHTAAALSHCQPGNRLSNGDLVVKAIAECLKVTPFELLQPTKSTIYRCKSLGVITAELHITEMPKVHAAKHNTAAPFTINTNWPQSKISTAPNVPEELMWCITT